VLFCSRPMTAKCPRGVSYGGAAVDAWITS
jgi:hypothetical protein